MRSRCILLLSAVLFAASACGGDDGGTNSEATATTTTVVTGAAVAETTAAPDTSAVPETTSPSTTSPSTTSPSTTTTEPADVSGCVVGSWLLQSQDFFDQLADAAGVDLQGATIDYLDGEYRLELRADGTGLAERDQWSFRTSTPEGALVTTITSTNPATYAIDGDIFTYEEQDGGPAEVTLEIEVGGTRQPMPGGLGTQTVASEPSSGTGPFTCTPTELAMIIEQEGVTVTARFDRR